MAWNSNSVGGQRQAGANIAEDVSNVVSNIDRDETSFLSSFGTNKATGPLHEWMTDVFAAPKANKAAPGFTVDTSTAAARQTARMRPGNRTQTFGAHIVADGDVISSNTIGVGNEYSYQLKKAMTELRRDVEFQFLRWDETGTGRAAALQAARSGSEDGQMSSVFAYASTWYNNTTAGVLNSFTATGTAGTASAAGANRQEAVNDTTGTRLVQFTSAPTPAAITRDAFERTIALMYKVGGKPNMAVMPVGVRSAVSALFFGGGSNAISQKNIDAMASKLRISIMGVVTDFGVDLGFAHNDIMDHSGTSSGADELILMYDTSKLKRSLLTPEMHEEDKQARYGRAGILYCEETLEVTNPNSIAVIAGVTNSLA